MKLLSRFEACVANHILILLHRADKPLTQVSLIEAIRARDRVSEPLTIMLVLEKLVNWKMVTREVHEDFDPLFMGDYKHNLATSPHLYTLANEISVFADLSPEARVVGPYEVKILRTDWIAYQSQWEESVLRLHRETTQHEQAANIIARTLNHIGYRFVVPRKHPVLVVSARDLVIAVQYDLFPTYPLLSPLVIQAWIEHEYVATYVDFVNRRVRGSDGIPYADYDIAGFLKTTAPTYDEILHAILQPVTKYPFHDFPLPSSR